MRDEITGYTKRKKEAGEKPLYSMRSIIMGIDDPKYEKLRIELEKSRDKKNIKVYSLQVYEPDEIRSKAELKRYYQHFVDYANYVSDQNAHDLTQTLISMVDPKSKYTREDDKLWPFYVMNNDIDWDKGYATDIIVIKKGDKNY